MDIVIERLNAVPLGRQRVEFVERKGLGHPDSICDAMMESLSVALSAAYLEHCGRVLHHNLDKGMLVAGQAAPRFGGGNVQAPMRLVVGDRATHAVGDKRVPVDEIVVAAARKWLTDNLRFVDPDAHLVVQNELRPGSAELTGIFARQQLVANDTSAAVGYAPRSETDRLVLAAERFLNSPQFKQEHPEAGEDVKVMGVRLDRCLELTVAVAMVDRFLTSEADYFARKQALQERLLEHLRPQLDSLDEIDIAVNTLDRAGCGAQGTYLTVLGTSAESADGGEVGRGNRVNGLITLNRPMTMEAAAGKNPVSHVGKIYNLAVHQLADAIWSSLDGVEEVYVWMCSRIGEPLEKPWRTSIQLALAEGVEVGDVRAVVQDVAASRIASLTEFTDSLVRGEWTVC